MKVYHDIPPFYDADSRILILGSMPSVVSRKEGFYYAHKQNRFWTVLEQVFDEKISSKEEFLHKHHIALWDVIKCCDIVNSSDLSIKNVVVNDISWLLSKTKIEKIFVTGNKAYELYEKMVYPDVNILAYKLSSTSSANARCSLKSLVDEYMVLKK